MPQILSFFFNLKLLVPMLAMLTASALSIAQIDDVGPGRAILFDGVDDYIDLGNIYDDVALPITISAWVLVEPHPDVRQYPVFTSQDNTNVYNGFTFVTSTLPHIGISIGDGRGGNHGMYRRSRAGYYDTMGEWVYITAVARSGNDMHTYMNGYEVSLEYQGSSSYPMNSLSPNEVAKIGYYFSNDLTFLFKGIMDEVRIWNRALSVSEIRESMCRRLRSDEPGLIGYWNFDETSGDQLLDLSANEFHGTLKGNPVRVFSGAPVGDQSAYLYSGNWSGVSVTHEKLSVTNIAGNPYGIHIYSVNNTPSQTGGLNPSDIDLPYYGVFLADDNAYSTFDLAFAENNVCNSFQRRDNSVAQWLQTSTLTGIEGRVEIIPAFEPGGLDVDLGDDTFFCDQSSFLLEAGVDAAGKAFLWNTGQTTPNITVTTSGEYAVHVTQDCLSDKDTINILFINSPPEFSLGSDESVCSMEPRTLTAGIDTDGYSLLWQDGSSDEQFEVTDFGTYWLKIQNACGSSTDSVKFIQKHEPNLQVDLGTDVTFCQKLPFFLLAHAEAQGKTFQWNTGENTAVITVNSSGIYAVEVKTECQTDRDTIHINFMTPPPAFSLGEDEALCGLEPRTLKPSIETNAFDLTWHDGSKERSFVADDFGTYWVKVENACGVSVDSITFTKQIYSDIEKYNFISPDNTDDKNQFFMLDEKLVGSQLAIFNRWGKPVYQSASYHNNWDGQGLPSGVYYYTVNGDCIEPLKGTVTIMR